MKKFLAILLALVMMLTLAACGKKEAQLPAYITQAQELIAQQKYEDAYKLLYANKSDAQATELLKDFCWVYEKAVYTNKERGVNTTTEYAYDAKGNRTKLTSLASYGTEYTFEYIYDAYGNMLKQTTTEADSYSIYEFSGYKLFYKPQK